MKETRMLIGDEFKQLCIKNKWYTKGTKKDFTEMIKYAESRFNVSSDDIIFIAENIKQYSDTRLPVGVICTQIAKICHSLFLEGEET